MAEAVGLAASIIGILQLAGKTIAVSYNYCSTVKSAPQDIRELLDELSNLQTVLESLQSYANANPESEALNKLNEPDGPIHGIDKLLKELYNKLEGKGGSKLHLGDRLKWPLREKETAKCVMRIERHKTLFIFALTADQASMKKEVEAYTKEMGNTIEEIKTDVRDTTLAIYDLKLMSKDTNEIVREIKADAYNTNVVIQSLQSESVAQRLWRQTQMTFAEAERRKSVLHWFYPDTFDTKHIEITSIRQPGTGDWLLRTPEVQEWLKKNPNSPILWGYGIPGAGKTFLCSVVIDHLQSQTTVGNHGLAYVYFDYKEQERQKPIHILASLVKQLLYQLVDLPAHIESLHRKLEPHGKRPTQEDLFSALVATLPEFDQVFFVFDALDECSQKKQRTGLLPLFHRMGKSGIHVFITSRQYPEDIQDSLNESAKIELVANNEDIRRYIEQKIDENARARRLVKQGKCRDLIIAELTDCARGMFLLVHFHIEFICEMTNVRLIFRALESLKNSSNEDRPLDPTYDRAMETVKNQGKGPTKLAMKILAWLVKAQRTMSVDELRLAVAVEEKRYELDEWDWTDKVTLLDVCAGLVTIDEKSNTIRLVHYTVQEYLLGNSLIEENSKFDIAMACATYLSFDIFSEPAHGLYAIYNRVMQHPFLHYAARYLSFHINDCREDLTVSLLLKLLENQGRISSYIQANNYRTVAEGGSGQHYPIQKPLHVASSVGHAGVVQMILDKGVDIELEDSNGEKALYMAALYGHRKVVEVLLMNGADISARGKNGSTILHTTLRAGHHTLFQTLIEKGTNISAQDENGATPLHIAAGMGNQEATQLILKNGAKISAPDNYGRTPLHHAVQGGKEAMIRLLLDHGADIETADSSGYRPLHTASINSHPTIVDQLLKMGANIEAREKFGETPLHSAARLGRNGTAQLLIDRGANIFSKTDSGFSMLHDVASSHHVSTAQLLLKNGADNSLLQEYGDAFLHEGLEFSAQRATMFLQIIRKAHAPPKPDWLLEIERKNQEEKERREREMEKEKEDQDNTEEEESEEDSESESEKEENEENNMENMGHESSGRQCTHAM